MTKEALVFAALAIVFVVVLLAPFFTKSYRLGEEIIDLGAQAVDLGNAALREPDIKEKLRIYQERNLIIRQRNALILERNKLTSLKVDTVPEMNLSRYGG